MKHLAKGFTMKASGLFFVLLASGLSTNVAYAQGDGTRFAKIYDVSDVTVLAEPGTDFSTLIVEATGQVNTGGWSDPELAVWSYIEPPGDGVLDLDFIARMPPDDAMVTMAFEEVTATLSGPMPPWVKGVRVHTSTNAVEAMLESDPSQVGLLSTDSEGNILADEVLPWPWKYFTPQQSETVSE